jgi:hypothetical protein
MAFPSVDTPRDVSQRLSCLWICATVPRKHSRRETRAPNVASPHDDEFRMAPLRYMVERRHAEEFPGKLNSVSQFVLADPNVRGPRPGPTQAAPPIPTRCGYTSPPLLPVRRQAAS